MGNFHDSRNVYRGQETTNVPPRVSPTESTKTKQEKAADETQGTTLRFTGSLHQFRGAHWNHALDTTRSADSHVCANSLQGTRGHGCPRSQRQFMEICRIFTLAIVLCALSLVSCSPNTNRAEKSEVTASVHQSTYAVTGLVMSVKSDLSSATIKHQKIPGYMEAMTMPFAVKDTNELAGLIPGEEITFNMIVTDDDMWMEQVQKTGFATNLLPASAGIRIVREVEPLEIGDALPEYHFTNELGQAVRLSQFKGNALVLSFLFTRCPVPTFCPLTARKLAKVQNDLLARSGGPGNWRILAITMDPEYDTPERLQQFGETYGANPERWSLLTGEWIDITALGEQFGLTFWKEEGVVNHNLRTVVVDANGIIRANFIGNEWTVSELVGEVMRAAVRGRQPNH